MKIQKTRVLLVEDNPMVQLVHKRMLDKVGCDYDLAEDGKQALEMSNNGYDLILMDIGLPQINGVDVAKQIRSREMTDQKNSQTPIIGLTAYGEEEMKAKCLAAGMDEVAVKPISQAVISDIVVRWTGMSDDHKTT